MEIHQDLKNLPILHFFACIVDPNGEHQAEDVVTALCEKFSIKQETKDNYHRISNALAMHVTVKEKHEMYFELPVYGYIRLWHNYHEITYKEHVGRMYESAVLEVNSNEIEMRKGWDDKEMENFKNTMLTLYSINKLSQSWPDIFDACWIVFDKGSKDNARDIFIKACEKLVSKWHGKEIEDNPDFNYGNSISKAAYFIKERWDTYLWDKKDSSELEDNTYWLGLQEFINRNISAWLDGMNFFKAQCRIYTDEHNTAVEYFKSINEPVYLYHINSIWHK